MASVVDPAIRHLLEYLTYWYSMQQFQRIAMVEYSRGFASLAVACFHLTDTCNTVHISAISGSYGYLGVEVFFVISGFVIPFSMWKSYVNYTFDDFLSFMKRRILRIEIPYLVSIFTSILVWHHLVFPGFMRNAKI